MRKVCFVVNSRANYARIKSTISAAYKNESLDVSIITGASAVLDRFGDVSKIIESDGFAITSKLYNNIEGQIPAAMAKSTGVGILDLTQEFLRIKPDLVVTVADRFETLATAVAASYMNIPLVHTQGGELT